VRSPVNSGSRESRTTGVEPISSVAGRAT